MLPSIHLDRIAPQHWANGGGHTRELLRWPAGAGADDWILRISVAEVDRDGPFSPLPGLERWFTVIDGAGVVLVLPEGRRMLPAGAAPLHFDGALAPACELIDGPTTDLNLMVRQSAGQGRMMPAVPDEEWVCRDPWRALYAADPLTLQVDDTDIATTRAGTLIWSDHGDRQRWRVRVVDPLATRGWWLTFRPTAGATR